MGTFGLEFVNARDVAALSGRLEEDDIFGFTASMLRLMTTPSAITIYFAPWSTQPPNFNDPRWRQPPGYQIGKTLVDRQMLQPHLFPDGRVRHTLVVPSHVTLWFAPGAYLELGDDVALIIQGGIRAEATQIFLLPDVLALRTTPWRNPTMVIRESALVRMETTAIERVHPEWFGVQHEESPTPLNAAANTRALQACIHAACRDRVRDGISLPPLTVVCQGVYSITETMQALPTTNGHGALWMEGIGDASTRGLGLPTIHRFPAGEVAAWRYAAGDAGQRPLRASVIEGKDSALLRVHPRVSLEISGVGLKCFPWNDGQERTLAVDVAHCILMEGRRGAVVPLVSRHAFIERCGITGGTDAIIGIFERNDPDAVVVARTDAAAAPPSGFERWDVPRSPPNPSQIGSQGSRTVLRGCSFDAVVNSAFLGGRVPARSSKTVVKAFLADASMLDVIGGKIHQVVGVLLGAQSGLLDNQAGLHLRGGSALVRSVTFHLDEGPRPSLPAHLADRPDGQDIWIDAGIDGRVAYHLTVLHADSQSWWFLGGTQNVVQTSSTVSLLNIGAQDVNLKSAEASVRSGGVVAEINGPYAGSGIFRDSRQRARLFLPPAVMWPGGPVPLLLLGCFFDRYCTTPSWDRWGPGMIVNVGTTFRWGLDLTLALWMTPDAIPRPESEGANLSAPGAPAIEGRAVPELWRGASRYSLYPAELRGRSALGGM